jgi:hypothetical protein
LLYSTYTLTYVDVLGLLKYIRDVVLFLLSRIDGKHGEQVEQHALVKQLAGHSAPQRESLRTNTLARLEKK